MYNTDLHCDCQHSESQGTRHYKVDYPFGMMFPVTRWLLIFGIFLGILHSCHSQSWKAFQKKHITKVTPSALNCTKEMSSIVHAPKCKPINTFIHATVGKVEDICNVDPGPKNVTSYEPFNLTICKIEKIEKKRCHYTKLNTTNNICVTCNRSTPVHFVRSGKCPA
ncbi:amphinase-2-like [Hyperolius riggenbachi]|uniref:amphinase-2-like n=1 Tax=Hyperolius riggenbachi TaxID=752182 RepID=UPI0035A3C4BA